MLLLSRWLSSRFPFAFLSLHGWSASLRGIKELELIVDSSLVTCSVGIPCVGSYSLKYLNIYILFFQIIASKKIWCIKVYYQYCIINDFFILTNSCTFENWRRPFCIRKWVYITAMSRLFHSYRWIWNLWNLSFNKYIAQRIFEFLYILVQELVQAYFVSNYWLLWAI